MAEEQVRVPHDIANFKNTMEQLIVKADKAWSNLSSFYYSTRRVKEYTKEEVEAIINSGNIIKIQELSQNFFMKDTIYKRILYYYATLLKYVGILIPNPISGTSLSTPYVFKRYNSALDFLDKISIPGFFTWITLQIFVNGCYYGLIQELNKNDLVLLDLPVLYCRSNFKDLHGNDIIEFNVLYFNSITDESIRKQTLKIYPKVVGDHYRRYVKGQVKSPWVRIPSDIGLCFPFTDDCRPFFIGLIPALMDYDDAVDINKERDLEEIRKIIVQHIPHLQDGALVFEPDEALEMHQGAVGMMRGNKNISVLTTYADVDAVVSNTSSEASTNGIEKSLQNVYSVSGVSGQLFAPTGSQALNTSITNDMALVMVLAEKYSHFLTYIVNFLFANTNINFKYTILPITWYNTTQYITDTFKLAQSGYSYLLPAIACGLSQKDLSNLTELENDALKLGEKLLPLSSAYTQSGSGQVGRPSLPVEDKSPKTIQNEESLDKQ